MKTHETHSPEETIQFAKAFAKEVTPGSVLCLEGRLGSGKTTFIKGLAMGLGLKNADREVKSPTFVLMHIYPTQTPLYHFDCYRLEGEQELEDIGFEEFIRDPKGISCVEWAEKASHLIPAHAVHLKFETLGENDRKITVIPSGMKA